MIEHIYIEVIPHSQQRYPTCGDYTWDLLTKTLRIYVSNTGDWRETVSVAIHELTEAVLCLDRGISQKQIDAFDIDFEKRRDEGKVHYDEPGVDPAAPYFDEHKIATFIEKVLVKQLKLKWNKYNKHLDDLDISWGE
jgi:hypothetical protein